MKLKIKKICETCSGGFFTRDKRRINCSHKCSIKNNKRYQQSEKYKENQRKYYHSKKGKTIRKESQRKYYQKKKLKSNKLKEVKK
ncbi:MAG TPA: hypothetical protein ENI61_06220 [Ignavibacteria bacterium]|nr:hypothetical protein [Ignavibacteria bacterium]